MVAHHDGFTPRHGWIVPHGVLVLKLGVAHQLIMFVFEAGRAGWLSRGVAEIVHLCVTICAASHNYAAQS